jgi:DNA modification methylase
MDKIYNCDIMEGFKKLDDKSVDCVITSPPYWQLRDYGFDGQWGLEPTFGEYLNNLWSMMDEIHRVLKDTGTVWINLGDTYSTKSGGLNMGHTGSRTGEYLNGMKINQPSDLKPKSLLLIPHRFAIGCYDRGWTIRNDIIWAKRNGMPESVGDRFSKKHEYIFLMTKKPKDYYFDLDSIRDEHMTVSIKRAMRGTNDNKYSNDIGVSSAQTLSKPRGSSSIDEYNSGNTTLNPKGKNPGDVADFWNITTKGNRSSHLASYNTDLIDKPILAGCPEGGVVLDPFSGTGTTLVRASQLGRKYIGFEASEQFFNIVKENIEEEVKRKNAPTLESFMVS